jgi:thimet oligopeptidase
MRVAASVFLAVAVAAAPARADPLAEALGPPFLAPAGASEVDKMCDARLDAGAGARSRFERLPLSSAPRALARAYDDSYGIFWSLSGGEARLMSRAHPDAAVREAAGRCIERGTQALDALRTSRPAYERLLRARRAGGASYMIDRQLDTFRRNGVARTPAELVRLAGLRADITRLGLEFERNIESDARSISVPEAALAGLPGPWIAARRQADGMVRIANIPPDVFAVARFSPDRDLRRRAMFFNRGEARNAEVLAQLLARRAELARLLGYRDFASYDLANRMAGTPEHARAFLDDIAASARRRAGSELARLLANLRKDEPDLQSLALWDLPYAVRRLRAADHQFDSERMRRYLPFARVRDGIFALAHDLYGVDIRPIRSPAWADRVTAYEVLEDGRRLGRFYLDPHPRPGKPVGNAWTIFFRTGLRHRSEPMAALLLNVPEDNLEHADLVVFLHEFGHLLHHIFAGRGEWAMANLFETELDALEAPSQMLEEWAWDERTLRRLAISADGEPIPEDLLRQLQATRYSGYGVRTLDDIGISAVSLELHRDEPAADQVEAAYRTALNRYSLVPDPPELHSFASFTHLSSYGAGYYTYVWSRALAADWFTKFRSAGVSDRDVAMRYRRAVLEPGATRPMNELSRAFLGRDWSPGAYRRQLETAGATD